jgi:hypothetical protein
MPLDFSPLRQIDPVGAFFRGQEAAQAQQERNMLRQAQAEQMQFQRENMLAQREERAALTQERQARQARAAQRQQFLTGAAEALAQGGNNLDRPTLMKVLQSGVQAEEPSLIQFARESLKALDEEELYQRESQRLSAAPSAAPTREEVQNMLRSPSPRMREQGKALLPTLPTPEKPMVVGGNLVSSTGQVLFTSPEKPRASQLLTPEEEAQKTRIALASRPPAPPREPAAPTIAQIQDPTDPNRMITIDARRYAGGGVGSPGVLGTSGKTAPAAAADQKKLEGQQAAADIIDTLRAAYQDLDQRRAVPSEQRSVLSNLTSYIASTGVGQVAGRMAGTPEQTQRDVIQSARNQILNAVKNATGMSAQQLNSNVEFKSWVESLTDPTKSYQANTAILDNLERFVASGGKYSAKKSGGAVTPAPAGQAPAGRREIAPGVFVTERP